MTGIDSKEDSQLPSQLIDRFALCHLSARQQGELLQILDKYAGCFSVRIIISTLPRWLVKAIVL